MIDCIFTLDYEIYGNGGGSLKDLVYGPAEQLREIFLKWNARFVNFVEVSELEQIEKHGTDPDIAAVKQQVRDLYREGFEIGLHLHPQWSNARHENGRWLLDLSEYNLCTLPQGRISEIVEQSLHYLRQMIGQPDFSPLSFRAGNWLFQPTEDAAQVLARNGLKIDSSVFKGGLQHNHTLDYRRALRNGHYWMFDRDVNTPSAGPWIEVPIYSEMVPSWKMATGKRLSAGNSMGGATAQTLGHKLNRLRDFARFRYPLKLDFTRMTLDEMTSMMQHVIADDRKTPAQYKPVVAIGHTKDLVDIEAVDQFLAFLKTNGIPVATFEDVYRKLSKDNSRDQGRGEPARAQNQAVGSR
jgi:hypothetical protein